MWKQSNLFVSLAKCVQMVTKQGYRKDAFNGPTAMNSSPCSRPPLCYPLQKPCFDVSRVQVCRCSKCHKNDIHEFLYKHYWPLEPSVVGTYMTLDSPYLASLTDKYITTGDKWLAYEELPRAKRKRAVGILVAEKIYPWFPDQYEKWAFSYCLVPERYNIFFRAHCIRCPNLFEKYNIPYLYDIEVLGTAAEVPGEALALLLVRIAMINAIEQRYPLVHIVSKNEFTHAVCEKAGLKMEWEMDTSEYIHRTGKRVFYPQQTHKKVRIYINKFDLSESNNPDACLSPELFKVHKEHVLGIKEDI